LPRGTAAAAPARGGVSRYTRTRTALLRIHAVGPGQLGSLGPGRTGRLGLAPTAGAVGTLAVARRFAGRRRLGPGTAARAGVGLSAYRFGDSAGRHGRL